MPEWQALIERIRQGDRAEVVAWHEGAAAGPADTYQVVVTQRVHQRLRDAPPLLAGSVAGIIAVLRVDPTEASMIFAGAALVMVAGRCPSAPPAGC